MLSAAISQFRPSLIAMPSLDDRHPDHGAAHVLVRLALAGQTKLPQLLTYLVHGHAPGVECIEIHGSAEQSANKQAAMAAHGSQMALSGNRMRRLTARPERYVDMSATPSKPSSALPWQPSAWLSPCLRLSVVSATETQSWRWRDAPLRRDKHGTYQLMPQAGVESPLRFARLGWDLPSLWIFDHWGWCEL